MRPIKAIRQHIRNIRAIEQVLKNQDTNIESLDCLANRLMRNEEFYDAIIKGGR